MKVNFEYMGEDKEVPGSKLFNVEAIHVGTTRNRRKFTKEELEKAAVSLSFRPLNINHDESRGLVFNEGGFLKNTTLVMQYNSKEKRVEGKIRVSDESVISMIENKKLTTVSIEQMPTKGESCSVVSCEQHGVAFIGLALLESEVLPGDPRAKIHTETFSSEFISDMTVTDEQRKCESCTDFVKCTKCEHKISSEDCMSSAMNEIKSAHPDWDKEKMVAVALSKCGKSKEEQFTLYEKFKDY